VLVAGEEPKAAPVAEARGEVVPGDLQVAITFFRQWLREPRSVAALAPSGRELARHMAAACGRAARRVVELGGGTGVVTRALLEHGVPPEGLLVLERNHELREHLLKRLPEVQISGADAHHLVDAVRGSARLEVGRVDAIASGLGLLNMSREAQRRLMLQALEVLRPRGRFVQFSYLPRCPLPADLRRELGVEARRVGWSLLNLPPAFVFVLRRRRR